MLTAKTITRDQIRELRAEAAAAGDEVQVDLCDLALHSSHGPENACSVCDARRACADVINARGK